MYNRSGKGKGNAVRQGVLASESSIVCFLDADLTIGPDHLEPFIAVIQDRVDIAIASRYARGTEYRYPVPWLRKMMGSAFRSLRLAVAGMPHIQDTQCGFKVFRGDVARKIFSMSRVDGFCFDVEILYLGCKLNCKIRELPVILNNSPKNKTTLNFIRDPLEMLGDLFKIKLNDFLGRYEIT